MTTKPEQEKSWIGTGLQKLSAFGALLPIVLICLAGRVAALAVALSVLYLFVSKEERASRPWAKAVKEFVQPALVGTAIVTVISLLYKLVGHGSGTRLIAWDEMIVVRLHFILKRIKPTWWLYLALLAVATWIDLRLPSWHLAAKLSKGKKWVSKTLAVVTLLAGVSFFGESSVTSDAYESIHSDLQVRYDAARAEKTEAIEKYVGERIVTAALQHATSQQQHQLQTCFWAAARVSYRNRYDELIAARLAEDEVKADNEPEPVHRVTTDEGGSRDADPRWLADAIPKEEAAARKAVAMQAAAKDGLEKMVKTVLGQASDKTAGIAISFFEHVADAYGGSYAENMSGVLKNIMEPLTAAYASQYVDKAVEFASSKVEWTGVPDGDAGEVTSKMHAMQTDIAQQQLTEAIKLTSLVAAEYEKYPSSTILRTSSTELSEAADRAELAEQVLSMEKTRQSGGQPDPQLTKMRADVAAARVLANRANQEFKEAKEREEFMRELERNRTEERHTDKFDGVP